MKIKNIFLFFPLLLCSCEPKEFDIAVKPLDFVLDYWIYDSVVRDHINSSHIFDETADSFYFLDSKYDLVNSESISDKKMPLEKVVYSFYKIDEMWTVGAIYITDPAVSIYGLSINSKPWKIKKFFTDRGFEYLDYFYGRNPCYSKDNIILQRKSAGIKYSNAVPLHEASPI